MMNSPLLFAAIVAAMLLLGDANITINPSHKNATVFEQQQFRRFCRYDGSLSNLNMLQILHNGTVRENSSSPAVLDIPEAVISDNGLYECQALLNSGIITGRTRMGYLTVIDRSLLNCPPEQYVVSGGSIQLQCSFQDPNNMYGLAITSSFRGATSMSQVEYAALENEGNYTCRVDLLDRDATLTLPFFLHVFTALSILSQPESYNKLKGIQMANFTVTFRARRTQNITTVWFRDGKLLQSTADAQLVTSFTGEMEGAASVIFPAMSRSDSGVYRVVVATEFGAAVLDSTIRKQEASFQVDVEVAPPPPHNFRVSLNTEHRIILQWELTTDTLPLHPDQQADTIMLYLNFPNGTVASHTALHGSATQAEVRVFPGVRYTAILRTENEDGTGQTQLNITTPNAAPYISHFESRRLNETHFNVSLSLLYSGGGGMVKLFLSYRESSSRAPASREWILAPGGILAPFPSLEWNRVVSGEVFRGKGPLEFEMIVENEAGFMNNSGPVPEIADRPGSPTTPTVKEPSATSIIIDFNLPAEGTPPFIEVIINFIEPSKNFAKNFSGFYQPGQRFNRELDGLSPQTAYSLKARAVNYAGDGPDSQTINFTTGVLPTDSPDPTSPTTPSSSSSPTWLLPASIGGSAVFIFAAVLLLLSCFVCCYCKQCRKKSNVYHVGVSTHDQEKDAERAVQELEPEHQMLQRKDKVSVVLATSPPSTKPSPTSMGKTKLSANHPFITQPMSSTKDTPSNIYITQHRDEPQLSVTNPSVIQHMQGVNRTSSTASSSPWNHKRNMENNHGSSSTLNSGSLVHQSQDSFIKKPDIHSASGSDFASLQFSQPDMQSCRTSRDSLSQQHKRKIANPSISSGGSGSTEMTERYQTTALLSPTEEETYSFTTVPFTPEGMEESHTTYNPYTPPNQYASDV